MNKLIALVSAVFLITSCSMLTNDLGIVELRNQEGLVWDNLVGDSAYPVNTEFTCIAVVENLGSEPQQNIQLHLEIYNLNTDPDSLVWENNQVIESIEKRSPGKSDLVEVEFPVFSTPSEDWFMFNCRVELENDENPENDEHYIYINKGIMESYPTGPNSGSGY